MVRQQFNNNLLLDASASSEKLIALLRIFIYLFISLVPFSLYFFFNDNRAEVFISIVTAFIAIILATIIYIAVTRNIKIPGLLWLITISDISLISFVLLLLAIYSNPLVATNSLIVWQMYGLVILATTLRLNVRITIWCGIICISQYTLLVLYLFFSWDLTDPKFNSEDYGRFSWSIQIGRVIVLALTTIIATGFVSRSRRLVVFSGTDSLTGLKNRAYFEYEFANSVKESVTSLKPLTLLFLDLDDFKMINDKYGHRTGDRALQAFADILNDNMSELQLAARWGGEEFVLMLPDTVKEEAVEKLEHINSVLQKQLDVGEEQQINIRFCAGVVECPSEGQDVHELISMADDRMLRAKRQGKNRVIFE